MNQLKYIPLALFIILSSPLFYSSAFAGTFIMSDQEKVEFARSSLDNYIRNTFTEKNIGNFGFKSLGEARNARIGKAYPVIIIGLKEIKLYRPGAKVISLNADTDTTWFPVTVASEVVAKLEIQEKDGQMIAGDFGARNESRRIAKIINTSFTLLKSKEITPENAIKILRVPYLKADFLFIESKQGEYLIPAMAVPGRFGLKNSVLYPSVEVLSRLKKHAVKIEEGMIR